MLEPFRSSEHLRRYNGEINSPEAKMTGFLSSAWTHLSLASTRVSAGSSNGASMCLTRDRNLPTSSSSLRTLKKTFYPRTDQKTRTLVLMIWFTWQEVMKPNRRGPPAGLRGRTAWRGRLRWRVSEKTSGFIRTSSGSVELRWKEDDSPAQILIPGHTASFCNPSVINPPADFMSLTI